ncbi:Pentatricopeptide repeat-containing protein 1 [Dufourea novaeangliae]|uniref:Pentatricopeptide repeat-containing protein 1 n=2 Tax=Dufourea novaeangliae TaxID=178035 RepID=A0A154P633_DUFNO|nr:Pentatricopeptide repeat-containing protein 1 [Dufourea novaeangliae]
MDKAEEEEERYIENDARVPRWQKLSHGQYCKLIKSHIAKGDLDLALSVLDLVKKNRDQPTVYMYSLLIYGFAHQGMVDQCFKLYNKLLKRGLIPNSAIYNSLINACATSENTTKALEYLQTLREKFYEKNIVLNETHFITLIKAYSWHKQLMTAFELADEARDKHFFSNRIYSVLFHAAISDKKNGLKYALILWHQMKKHKLKPSIFHYNLLLRAIRDTEFGELNLNDCLIPNSSSTQILLNETGNSDLLDSPPVLNISVLNLIRDELQDKYNNHSVENNDSKAVVAENNVILSENLNKILEKNRLIFFGGIELLLKRMESDNVTPDIRTMTLLVELLPPSLEAERQLLKYIAKEKIEVDICFFNILMKRRNYRKQYKEAKEILADVQRHHLSPDIMTFGILAMGCTQLRNGIELLEQMDNIGFVPNYVVLGALIRTATYSKDFRYIEFLLNYILENKVKPSKFIFETLENFETLILQYLKIKNRYNRKELRQLQRDYNYFKIFYEEWKEKMQQNVVKMTKKQ